MENETISKNFIENIIDKDLAEGVYDTVHTRFPPEPNGYLHIGHAKSILLNYGLAQEYNGKFNMRFDDTNPTKEKTEFVESIKEDIHWLGADWEDRLFFASDYFDQMYEAAVKLIKKGKAFVCDLTADVIRQYRGTLTEPGKESPYRNRSVEENLQLFEEMKEGKYADGEKVLRAKIDMASPNMNMRDPVIYRVAHMTHHNTGDKWCIYPMYDFAHPIEDAIEGITHSICTLEFEDHRPLYDWVVKELEYPHPPKQIEFAKLYLTNVVTGKRYIKKLVEEGIVDGWDDPRLVSIAALRRRGFTPESIKMFVDLCGVSKANSSVDYAMLEYCIREDLKLKRPRMMAVLDPIKLVIDNYPEGEIEYLDAPNNMENESLAGKAVQAVFKYLGLTEITDEQVEAVTYAHGSRDTLKRDAAADLMSADEMMKRGITGVDVVKALAESGYTELAENILNMLKQRVIGDYMHTAAILDEHFQVMSGVNTPNDYMGPGTGYRVSGKRWEEIKAIPHRINVNEF